MKKMSLFNGIMSLAIVGLLFIPMNIHASGTIIKANYIKVNNNKFRRGGAESASLGAIGTRNRPIVNVSVFNRDSKWKAGRVGIEIGIPVIITSNQTTELEGNVAANLDSAGTVRVGASAGNSSEHSAGFSIVKMTFNDEGQVIHALNRLPKSERKRIKKLGKKRRIITSVWVLIYGNESSINRFTGTATVEDATGNNADITVTTTTGSSVTFGPGTIVAYEYKKIKFGKKKKIKKLKKDGVWP